MSEHHHNQFEFKKSRCVRITVVWPKIFIFWVSKAFGQSAIIVSINTIPVNLIHFFLQVKSHLAFLFVNVPSGEQLVVNPPLSFTSLPLCYSSPLVRSSLTIPEISLLVHPVTQLANNNSAYIKSRSLICFICLEVRREQTSPGWLTSFSHPNLLNSWQWITVVVQRGKTIKQILQSPFMFSF